MLLPVSCGKYCQVRERNKEALGKNLEMMPGWHWKAQILKNVMNISVFSGYLYCRLPQEEGACEVNVSSWCRSGPALETFSRSFPAGCRNTGVGGAAHRSAGQRGPSSDNPKPSKPSARGSRSEPDGPFPHAINYFFDKQMSRSGQTYVDYLLRLILYIKQWTDWVKSTHTWKWVSILGICMFFLNDCKWSQLFPEPQIHSHRQRLYLHETQS